MSGTLDGRGVDVRHVFAADVSGPVTVVFATYLFHDMVRAWIEHARRAGCLNYRIICMDLDLLDALREEGDRAVYFWDMLPDVREERIDTIPERHKRLALLTRLRTKFFLHLTAHGIDFVHSDADALWLRDPRPWLLKHKGFDLLFSQGTMHPFWHFESVGFTICAGFFFARASALTHAFFQAAERMEEWQPSDQARFNEILLRDSSGRWEIEAPRLALTSSQSLGSRIIYWRYARWKPRVHVLLAWILGGRMGPFWTRAIRAALRLRGYLCIITSARVMTKRFVNGLTVGVIPMRLVERVPLADSEEMLVCHTTEAKHRIVLKSAHTL